MNRKLYEYMVSYAVRDTPAPTKAGPSGVETIKVVAADARQALRNACDQYGRDLPVISIIRGAKSFSLTPS